MTTFTVSASLLEKALRPVISVVPAKAMMPSLEFIRLDIENNMLTITGTDLDRTIRSHISVEASESFSFLIKGRIFYDWLKLLNENPVTLQSLGNDSLIEASISSGTYRFPSLPLEEFPALPPFDPTSTLRLPEQLLQQALTKTAFCMSKDSIRENMMGVFFEVKDHQLNLVATDTTRLSIFSTEMPGVADDSFLVPAPSIHYLRGLLQDADREVTIEHDQGHARFTVESVEVYTRLLDRRFPDYRVAIPAELLYHVEIEKSALLTAMRRVLILTEKDQTLLRFSIRNNEMILQGEDTGFNTSGEEKLTCQSNTEDFHIAFKGKDLLEIINAVNGDTLVMKLLANNKPVVFEPATPPEGYRHMMLMMPLI